MRTTTTSKEQQPQENDASSLDDDSLIQGGQSLLGESQSTSSSMAYQYIFEEGLEMSLVPEHEVIPYSAGPKILELGLSGFTGRLIITQQTVKRKPLEYRTERKEDRRRESVSSSSTSSSQDGAGRIPLAPYQARQAAATTSAATKSRPPLPPDTSKRKDKGGQGKGGGKSPRKRTAPGGAALADAIVDDIAAVFVSQEAARPLPISADNLSVDTSSVEVVSVASSVSTRAAAARAQKEETLDQMAAVFATPVKLETEDKVPIDDGSSMGSMATEVAAAIAKKEEQLNEFAAVFAVPTKITTEDKVPIDESSSFGGSSSVGRGGGGTLRSIPETPLEEFTTAFVALSGPPIRPAVAGVRALAIDEESSASATTSSNAVSAASSGAPRPSSSQPIVAEDPISDFTAVFVELSGPNTRHTTADVGGSIDSSTKVAPSSSASSQSSKSAYTYVTDSEADDNAARSSPERPAKQEETSAADPVAQFAEVLVSLSEPPKLPQDKLGSIDEESPSASSASSAVAASAASSSSSYEEEVVSQQSEQPSVQPKQPAPHPLPVTVASLMAIPVPPRPPQQTDLIDDEDQPSLATSSSLSSSSSSSSGSEQAAQVHTVQQIQTQPQTLDPLDEYAEVFGSLTSPPVAKKPTEVIDEESPESKDSRPSVTQSKTSMAGSEDRAQESSSTQTPQKQPDQSSVGPPRRRGSGGGGGGSSQVVPEPPRGKSPADTALRDNSQSQQSGSKASSRRHKRRTSQQTKVKGSGPKISSDKKRRIREMFPNYPDVGTGTHGSLDPVGVYLHRKCSAPFEKTLTPRDLSEMLEVFPFAAYCADDKGRLPLHILGENSRLVEEPQGRQRATSLARLLIQAYPQSVTYPDSEGRLPFVALLQQWIDAHYAQVAESRERGSVSDDRPISYDRTYPNFELWPYAEWCMNMIAMVLDDMVGTGLLQEAFANRPVSEQMEARRRYVGDIVDSVPYLIKSVLFLDGGLGAARRRVTQNSFFRRALLCREGVGKWLQDMVKRKGLPLKLAIDYFQLLSQTTPVDFVGPKRSPDNRDVDAFHYEREKVYRAIEGLGLVIPSQVAEETAEVEGAAAPQL